MNDPHVEHLRYRLETTETLGFKDPDPIEGTNDIFDWQLEDSELTLNMKQHFASEEEAQQAVSDFLRSWELYVNLYEGREAIHFQYVDAHVIDRNPPPPGSPQVLHAKSIRGEGAMMGTPTIRVQRNSYPTPPEQFQVSPDVETLWNRYRQYVEGKEQLLSMAYFCLTVLESDFPNNKRAGAARKYGIHVDVLQKLGELTTTRGDERTARKAEPNRNFAPLTGKEEEWIRTAVKSIIRRVGEHNASGSAAGLPEIGMNDLSTL